MATMANVKMMLGIAMLVIAYAIIFLNDNNTAIYMYPRMVAITVVVAALLIF